MPILLFSSKWPSLKMCMQVKLYRLSSFIYALRHICTCTRVRANAHTYPHTVNERRVHKFQRNQEGYIYGDFARKKENGEIM